MYKLENKNSLSRYKIEIDVNHWMDPKDPWFIDIKYIWKTTGEIKKTYMIIRSDLDDWLESFKASGWEIQANNINI